MIFDFIRKELDMEQVDAAMYSPLTLAYIGDCIYEIVIRTMIVAKGNATVNKLHHHCAALVKASSQAVMMRELEGELTEGEHAVFKRGRNAKSYSSAKNASLKDYRMATAFESLMGYLYLSNQDERMMELIKKGLEILDGREEAKRADN